MNGYIYVCVFLCVLATAATFFTVIHVAARTKPSVQAVATRLLCCPQAIPNKFSEEKMCEAVLVWVLVKAG